MILVIWRHRPNIVRLLEGSEPHFSLSRGRKNDQA
jgi:glycerol-3-phosphate acyltransferase PlsY